MPRKKTLERARQADHRGVVVVARRFIAWIERRRRSRVLNRPRGGRLLVQVQEHVVPDIVPRERQLARQKLEQQAAQAVLVAGGARRPLPTFPAV